jgi:LDH2 family malate/lactate/ureidoglycolate dehydrogenase
MAQYPDADTDRRVKADELSACVTAIFEAVGMAQDDAALLTDSLVRADLRGIHSHGVIRVPDYVRKMRVEGVDPRGTPKRVSRRGGAIVVDGANTMGQIGGRRAMSEAIAAARETGIAFAALNNSNHCGSLDWFTLMAAEAGMVGIAGSNALPTMAPLGGTEKIIGMNPISVAVPSSADPFVLDLAFGATAHGKIRVYAQKGHPIPEGWALDADGRPTTDATAALDGLIQPAGGHKGIALAMAVGILSSLLSGAAYGTELGNMVDGPTPGKDGQFFIAIDIAAFTGVEGFRRRVDVILDQVRHSRKAAGTTRLLVPGEMERGFEEDYGRNGILLPGQTVLDILHAADSLALDGAGWASRL